MRHKMLTQRIIFIARDGKKSTLSQHFVTHVVPPLGENKGEEGLVKLFR